MTKGERITKQIIVAIVFLFIIGGVGYGGYAAFTRSSPTPTPNPTINLSPVAVTMQKLINIENNDYDFLAKVSNPNTDYGSPDVEYQLSFFDDTGVQIDQKIDSFYILPGQTKYVINTPLKFGQPVSRVEMTIKSIDWQQMDPNSPENISLISKNIVYSQSTEPGVFSKVGGEVQNSTDFDFSQVTVTAVVFDSSGEPMAAGKTEIMTFLSQTSRGFEVSWYKPFAGVSSRTEVGVYTNIFENSNFIRQYGRPEKFQQFY